jgi:glucose/arabinose dehydrogenase
VLRLPALIVSLALVAAGAGCGDDEDTRTASTPPPPANGGEDKPPPVGDGEGGVVLEELGEFDQPLYVTQPSSGDPDHVYVVEKCGTVQRVPIGGGGAQPFLDISDRVGCEGSEQGLLSIAFAPDYERSGLLYADYTDSEGDSHVVEFEADGSGGSADPDSAREVLFVDQPYENHNGGLVLFGPDRQLYIGFGDGGSADDPERRGQDLSTQLGKILRIDPRESGGEPFSVPGDNPFAGEPGALPEIAINGMRNPWRFSFDRETDALWIGDVGQDSLEEIDSVTLDQITERPGLNFGWSAYEGSERFNEDQEAPGALPPTLEYGRDGGCSVTGGYVVRDPELESLYGRYIYGDFCEGELRSFPAKPGQPARDDVALGVDVSALSSFGEDADGRIYATSLDGPVYRLAPEKP